MAHLQECFWAGRRCIVPSTFSPATYTPPKKKRLQDWRALFKILRDVQLTEKFERPVDKKYLQRTLGLEEEEEKVEREDGEPSKEPEIEIKEDESLVLEEPEEAQNFDPEDPEGGSAENGGAVPSQEELSMPVGFQLLKHVDSPEPEEPDEARSA